MELSAAPAKAPVATSSASAPLKRLVVLDVELVGDVGPSDLAAERRQRLRTLSAKLRDELDRSHLYAVVDNAPAAVLIDRLGSGQYLHQCNGCELDIAKQLGAEQVLVPWIHRMSALILTLHVEIRDVATGRTLMKKGFDFRGENDAAWERTVRYLIRDLKEQRAN
jgi:hypothetical protein